MAIASGGLGYAAYLAALRRYLVEPNRASWLIWAGATGVEAATYAAINPARPQAAVLALSAAACVVVAAAMWRQSRWTRPDPTESLCIGAALAAIVLWVAFDQSFWAHMLVVAAVPVSFWPTWAGLVADRSRERPPAWALWTLADAATLALAINGGGHDAGTLAYPIVELACHASVWLLAAGPFDRHRQRDAARLVEAWTGRPAAFAIGRTHLGKAVFAARSFDQGERLVRFGGRRVRPSRPAASLRGSADRFVQVGADRYLGPSGRIDDLVNHSCDPNAGVRFGGGGIDLVALRPIAAGEEISWDYSTTSADPDWQMACACGTAGCRGRIAAFATLPPERQAWYRERGLVAPYLIRETRAA